MQQLYALGALSLALLLHFNVTRSERGSHLDLVDQEVAALGADLIQNTFEEISALPFDVVDAEALAELTRTQNFGGTDWVTASDLDDLDGATTARTVAGPDGSEVLSFQISAEVEYVEKVGTTWVPEPMGHRTWFKRVTLSTTGPSGFQAQVERVFTAFGV